MKRQLRIRPFVTSIGDKRWALEERKGRFGRWERLCDKPDKETLDDLMRHLVSGTTAYTVIEREIEGH